VYTPSSFLRSKNFTFNGAIHYTSVPQSMSPTSPLVSCACSPIIDSLGCRGRNNCRCRHGRALLENIEPQDIVGDVGVLYCHHCQCLRALEDVSNIMLSVCRIYIPQAIRHTCIPTSPPCYKLLQTLSAFTVFWIIIARWESYSTRLTRKKGGEILRSSHCTLLCFNDDAKRPELKGANDSIAIAP